MQSVHEKDNKGGAPLQDACWGGYLENMRLLPIDRELGGDPIFIRTNVGGFKSAVVVFSVSGRQQTH